jgi:hypothetical protein
MYMLLDILVSVIMKSSVVWDVTPCTYLHFGGMYYLCQSSVSKIYCNTLCALVRL